MFPSFSLDNGNVIHQRSPEDTGIVPSAPMLQDLSTPTLQEGQDIFPTVYFVNIIISRVIVIILQHL
jgi:hypothetical protein